MANLSLEFKVMAKKIGDHLFELIQSLEKSEKRYFKIYASRHVIGEENTYFLLYDHMVEQPCWDETKVKEEFQGNPMLNNLTITLHRLYDHLLKALESYHGSSTAEIELRHLFNYAEILLQKSLYSACYRICKKIKKLAEENDLPLALYEHNLFIKRLMEIEHYEESKLEEIQAIKENDEQLLLDLGRLNSLWFCKSKVLSKLNREGNAQNAEDKAYYEKIEADLVEPQAGNFEESYFYFHTKAASNFARGNLFECREYIQQNQMLFERFPEKMVKQANRYVSLLSNAIYVNQAVHDFREAQSNLFALKSFELSLKNKMSSDLELKLFNSIYSTELMLFIQMGNFEKNLELIPSIDEKIKHYGDKLSSVRKVHFYYCFAVTHLATNNPRAALKNLQILLETDNSRKNEEMRYAGLLLQLLALTDLNDSEALPHFIKAGKRQLMNVKKFGDFEKWILKVFEKLAFAKSGFEREELAADLMTEFLNNQPMFQKSSLFHIFPFQCWLESKSKKTTLSLCVKNQLSALSK